MDNLPLQLELINEQRRKEVTAKQQESKKEKDKEKEKKKNEKSGKKREEEEGTTGSIRYTNSGVIEIVSCEIIKKMRYDYSTNSDKSTRERMLEKPIPKEILAKLNRINPSADQVKYVVWYEADPYYL